MTSGRRLAAFIGLVATLLVASCGGDGWEPDPQHSIVSLVSNDVWDVRTLRDAYDTGTLGWQEGCAVMRTDGQDLLPVFSAESRAVRQGDKTGVQLFDETVVQTGDVQYGGYLTVVPVDQPLYPHTDPGGCAGKVTFDGITYVLLSVDSPDPNG